MKRHVAALLTGALIVGTLDILFAIGFWWGKVPPPRIFQSVAAGLLGRKAYDGGNDTVILGAALHYLIAFCIVFVYWLASRAWEALIETPLFFGAMYGLVVYGVMNYVVIPLSATGRGSSLPLWIVASVIVHMFLVGVPAALAARYAATAAPASPSSSRSTER